jgi:Integrase core domain
VFTGRFFAPPVEVLFDAICREHGIEHLLTLPRSPTTTGKIERFHRTLRAEFDTRQIFTSLQVAQQALDEWVGYYNTARPHQALNDATPAERFSLARDTADSRSSSATPVAPTRAVINGSRRRRLDLSPSRPQRHRLCQLATGLDRQTSRRATLRRPRQRPTAAILDRRRAGQNRDPNQHRGGEEETRPRRQTRA